VHKVFVSYALTENDINIRRQKREIMTNNGDESKIRWVIKLLLNFLLILIIVATVAFVTNRFFIPAPDEYDDPSTEDIQESFPWNPNIMTDGLRVLQLFGMGALRHLAILPQHVTTINLISMIGYVFFVLFIYGMRETFESGKEIGIDRYVQWGIGSIIGAIIYLGETVSLRSAGDTSIAILWFSVACVIRYVIHSRYGILLPLQERIRGTKKTEKRAGKKK